MKALPASEDSRLPFVCLAGLIGAVVRTADSRQFGRIDDLVVSWDLWMSHPAVTAVVIDVGKSRVRIDAAEVVGLPSGLPYLRSRCTPLSNSEAAPEEVWLRRNVLQGQIVDARGRKMFCVSDAYLAPIGSNLCLVAVETSGRSLIKRLSRFRGSRLRRERTAAATDGSSTGPRSG